MEKVFCASLPSAIGTIHVASTSAGVCAISVPAKTQKDLLSWIEQHVEDAVVEESQSKNRQILDELERYFDRRVVRFRSTLDLRGTAFQRRVWSELRKIPYGTVIPYKELARRVGRSKGYRAVGRANAANPLPIVIPCHRVVGSDGNVVGYGAGIPTKEFLLRLEGAKML